MRLQEIEPGPISKARNLIQIANAPFPVLVAQERIKILVARRGMPAFPLEGSVETQKTAAAQQ